MLCILASLSPRGRVIRGHQPHSAECCLTFGLTWGPLPSIPSPSFSTSLSLILPQLLRLPFSHPPTASPPHFLSSSHSFSTSLSLILSQLLSSSHSFSTSLSLILPQLLYLSLSHPPSFLQGVIWSRELHTIFTYQHMLRTFFVFILLVQCPFETFKVCLFGTGRLLGLQYCCLQLSREPLIQATSHSTLCFLGSSAIHPL